MGLSGISPLSLLLILAIVVLLFGTKRVRQLGLDAGEMLKAFREGVHSDQSNDPRPLDQTKAKDAPDKTS